MFQSALAERVPEPYPQYAPDSQEVTSTFVTTSSPARRRIHFFEQNRHCKVFSINNIANDARFRARTHGPFSVSAFSRCASRPHVSPYFATQRFSRTAAEPGCGLLSPSRLHVGVTDTPPAIIPRPETGLPRSRHRTPRGVRSPAPPRAGAHPRRRSPHPAALRAASASRPSAARPARRRRRRVGRQAPGRPGEATPRARLRRPAR